MISMHSYINQLDLQLDERHRGDCPVCNGRNTFTVSRTLEGILYNCYKAGCNLSGTKTTFVTVQDALNRKERSVDKGPFVLPDHVVPNRKEIDDWAKDNFIIGTELLYDVKEDRIVFPVVHDRKVVDATGRSINKYKKPKWKRYGSSQYAYTIGRGIVAVVVEDCISAARVSNVVKNCVGVALMGTSLLPKHIEQLKDFDVILVALDPDAVKKTLEFTATLRAQLDSKNIFAVNLEDDLKYARKKDIVKIQNRIGEYDGIGSTTHTDGQRVLQEQ